MLEMPEFFRNAIVRHCLQESGPRLIESHDVRPVFLQIVSVGSRKFRERFTELIFGDGRDGGELVNKIAVICGLECAHHALLENMGAACLGCFEA